MARGGSVCDDGGMNENTGHTPKRRWGRSQIDALLNGFHQSGLSVRAFCEREKVACSQLYKWLRREREGHGAVVEVDLPLASAGQYTIQWPDGRRLSIPYDAPQAQTRGMIRMLEGRP